MLIRLLTQTVTFSTNSMGPWGPYTFIYNTKDVYRFILLQGYPEDPRIKYTVPFTTLLARGNSARLKAEEKSQPVSGSLLSCTFFIGKPHTLSNLIQKKPSERQWLLTGSKGWGKLMCQEVTDICYSKNKLERQSERENSLIFLIFLIMEHLFKV